MHSQAVRDWGIILSPNFNFDREVFLIASLIPYSYVDRDSGDVLVDFDVLPRNLPTTTEGVKLLVDAGFAENCGNRIRIGKQVSFLKNEYFFQFKTRNAQQQGLNAAVQKSDSFKTDPMYNWLRETTESLYETYYSYMVTMRLESKCIDIGNKVIELQNEIYAKSVITPSGIHKYFMCYETIIYNYLELPSLRGDVKTLGICSNILKILPARSLLNIIPYYILNAKKFTQDGQPTLNSFLYKRTAVVNSFSTFLSNQVPSGNRHSLT